MPNGKGTRWYPFGKPDWWREFIGRETRGWQQIGQAARDIFDPRTPIWGEQPTPPSPYAPSKYPMPTFAPMTEEERARAFRREAPEIDFTGFGLKPGVWTPSPKQDRKPLIESLATSASALGVSLDEIRANLIKQLETALRESLDADESLRIENQLRAIRGGKDVLDVVPYGAMAQLFTQYRNQIERMPFGRMDIEGERRRLAEGVGAGVITPEKAFGKGTPWEKWQHGEVEKVGLEGQAGQQQMASNLIKQAELIIKQGKGTSGAYQAADKFLRQYAESYGQIGMDIIGQELVGLSYRGTMAREQEATETGGLLAGDYPKWWEEFQPRLAQAGESDYMSPEAGKAMFGRWLPEQEGFEAFEQEREARRFGEYPSTYPWYQRAGGLMGTKQTFPAWLKQPEQAAVRGRELEAGIAQRSIGRRTPRWAVARA